MFAAPLALGQETRFNTFTLGLIEQALAKGGKVVSNQRFYYRRAAEERVRASRALTPAARAWHQRLANEFAERAVEPELQPVV